VKIAIDNFVTTDGWTTDGTASAYALNTIQEYIADLNDSSLILKFPSGNLNKYIEKAISPAITITGYTEIVFYIWSRNKSGYDFKTTSDYNYKINLGGSDYYVPIYPGFNCVVIYTTADTVNKIKITALHDDEDYILLSEMNAIKEDFPLDIYEGLKAQFESEIERVYADGILIGTVTCKAGDQKIKLTADDYLDRFAVIKIKDGTHSEIHQLWEFDEATAKFTSLYDGKFILYDYTDASLYLQLPVEFMNTEKEMIIPSIVIYGLTAERVWRGAALEDIEDSVTDAGASIRREGAIEKFYVNVHCYARQAEILSFLTRVVRHVVNKQALWVNGAYYEMNYEGTVSDVDPNQVYDLVPQMIYQISAEIKEEMFDRVIAVPITDTSIDITIESQGVLS
jgi:hypothetical protein